MRPLRPLLLPLSLSFVLAATTAACGDDEFLASVPNVVDTVTVAALTGTPVSQPSAFSVADGIPVRTDQANFDFAFEIQDDGTPVFLPVAAMGLPTGSSAQPGLQLRPEAFEAITVARSNGYITEQPVPIAVGQVYMARSRIVCAIGVPLYGKLEILELGDDRTVTFQVLTNNNCGFTGLEPGLPPN